MRIDAIGLRPGDRTWLGTPGVADMAIMAAGGLLALQALRRPGRTTPLLAAAGAGLLYRGLTGANPIERIVEQGPRRRDEAVVARSRDTAASVRSTTIQHPVDDLRRLVADQAWLDAVTHETAGRLKVLPRPRVRVERDGTGDATWRLGVSGTPVGITVREAPGDRGAELTATIDPDGRRTLALASTSTVEALLTTARELLEAGSTPTTAGQPSGIR